MEKSTRRAFEIVFWVDLALGLALGLANKYGWRPGTGTIIAALAIAPFWYGVYAYLLYYRGGLSFAKFLAIFFLCIIIFALFMLVLALVERALT